MFDIVTVSGSPRERGRQHGEAARAKVRSNCETTYQRIEAAGLADRSYVPTLRAKIDRAVERHAPYLREEMEGVAEGAGVLIDEILTLNAYPDLSFGPSSCTTAMLREISTNEMVVWQNNDAHIGYATGMIVLNVLGDISHTQITYAGVVGESGLNAAGLAIAGNGLGTGNSQDGVPFFLLLRIILDTCSTVDDAVATLRALPRAAGMTYAVADADGAAAYIETSAAAVEVCSVEEWAAHSNHCLVDEVRQTESLRAELRINSEGRLASAEDQIRSGERTVETLMSIARSHASPVTGICQHRETGGFNGYVESLYGFIAAPVSRRMWLASGSPCENEFEELEPAWVDVAA